MGADQFNYHLIMDEDFSLAHTRGCAGLEGVNVMKQMFTIEKKNYYFKQTFTKDKQIR